MKNPLNLNGRFLMKRMVLLMSVFFTSMVGLLFSPVVFGTPLSDVNQELMGRAYEQIHGVHAREMFVGLKKILKLKDDRKFIQDLIEQTPKSQKIKLSVSGNDLVMRVGGEKVNVGFQKAIEGKFLINGKELNATSHRSFRSLYTAINKLYQKPSKSPSVFLSLIAPKAHAVGIVITTANMLPISIAINGVIAGITWVGMTIYKNVDSADERLLESLNPTEFTCRRDKKGRSFSDITVGGKKYTLGIKDGDFSFPRIKNISSGDKILVFAGDGLRELDEKGLFAKTDKEHPRFVQESDFSGAFFKDLGKSPFTYHVEFNVKALAEKNFKPLFKEGLTTLIADCCEGALQNFQSKKSAKIMGDYNQTCEEKVQQAIAKKHPKKDSQGDGGGSHGEQGIVR